MIETFFPRDPVARALTRTTMAFALSSGVFYTVSALYFTRVIGLTPTTVGLGLGIAGGAAVAASYGAGWLSDRTGAHRVQVWATALQGLAILAYVGARDVWSFTVVAVIALVARASQGTARQALLARWYTGADRVTVRARMRVVTNVFIGLGTTVAALALLIDTPLAYQAAMLSVGALLLLATIPIARLPRRVPDLAARMLADDDAAPSNDDPPGRRNTDSRHPLRDRTYVTSVALNSVVAMHFGLQTIGVPLWVATTDAPKAMVSALLVLNTILVASLQVRASRGTHDVRLAGVAVRRGGWLLAAACLVYAGAAYGNLAAACALLVIGAVLHSLAEILAEAGGWGMAFELADPRRAGAYQGLTQTGYALAAMLSPIAVTVLAIRHGTLGWIALAVLFAAAGTGAAALARQAASRPASARHPDPVTTAA